MNLTHCLAYRNISPQIFFCYQVSGVEIMSGGIVKLQVSEAEVNNINIRFLDKM